MGRISLGDPPGVQLGLNFHPVECLNLFNWGRSLFNWDLAPLPSLTSKSHLHELDPAVEFPSIFILV